MNYTMDQINAVRDHAESLGVHDWISGERAVAFLNWYYAEQHDRSIEAQKNLLQWCHDMTVVDELEQDEHHQLRPSLVSVKLAAKIKLGLLPTQKPVGQMVARIQCIMVKAGYVDDAQFVDQLYATVEQLKENNA